MIVFPIGRYLLDARKDMLFHESGKRIDLKPFGLILFYMNLNVSLDFKENYLFDVYLDRYGLFIRLGPESACSHLDDISFE